MNNILPKNSLCAKLLPQSQDSIRFLKNFKDSQEANYEVLESKTNKIWGYVSIDNTERGPGLGGIRLVQNISENEIKRLARVMTLKNSAACLPHGGAKSGLILNSSTLKKIRKIKKEFIEKFSVALFELDQYVPAPDMGTDEYDIQIVYEHHSKNLKTKV